MAKRRDDFLSNLDDEFLECRARRHKWEPVGNYMNGQGVYLVEQCGGCDSYAVSQWHKSAGTVEGRRKPYYTPGYLNLTGEPVTKADARVEYIRRRKFQPIKAFEKLMDQIDEEMESYR